MRKNILCFGDSNTYGYCTDPNDSETGHLCRFSENERWTSLLQKKLGDDFLVIEEGLNGRTTVFEDPFEDGLSGRNRLLPTLEKHKLLDLLIIMLGTNDTKSYFSAEASDIARGMEQLVELAKGESVWAGESKILVISPPAMPKDEYNGLFYSTMGEKCVEKSQELANLYEVMVEKQSQTSSCYFVNADSFADGNRAIGSLFNKIDFMHLTMEGHEKFANGLAPIIKNILYTSS